MLYIYNPLNPFTGYYAPTPRVELLIDILNNAGNRVRAAITTQSNGIGKLSWTDRLGDCWLQLPLQSWIEKDSLAMVKLQWEINYVTCISPSSRSYTLTPFFRSVMSRLSGVWHLFIIQSKIIDLLC